MVRKTEQFPDPRTKIVLILTVSGLLIQCGLSETGILWNGLLLTIPLGCYLACGKYRKAVTNGLLYGLCLCLLRFWLPVLSGTGAIVLSAVCALFVKIMPGIVFGLFLISTVEAADLIAALLKLHLPGPLIWTISIVFRFFPTAGEELRAAWEGVRLRGHSIPYCLCHPIGTLVDVFVPLIVSVVNIGDELLMATLTKGFDLHGPRTSISQPRLRTGDYGILALCGGLWAVQLIMK